MIHITYNQGWSILFLLQSFKLMAYKIILVTLKVALTKN